MPAFTLYGARGSTNTSRVRLTLAEGGFTDFELVVLNLGKGEQKVGAQFLLKDDGASLSREPILISLTPLYSVRRKHETSPMG